MCGISVLYICQEINGQFLFFCCCLQNQCCVQGICHAVAVYICTCCCVCIQACKFCTCCQDRYAVACCDCTVAVYVAERTEDTIEQYYDIVEDLDVPMSSKNYSSWKDIVALYDDLDNRIDAICDAWEISLKYAKPADHKDEIVAPLAGDNEPGTNSNKYRQDFEDRYPGAKPVEVN